MGGRGPQKCRTLELPQMENRNLGWIGLGLGNPKTLFSAKTCFFFIFLAISHIRRPCEAGYTACEEATFLPYTYPVYLPCIYLLWMEGGSGRELGQADHVRGPPPLPIRTQFSPMCLHRPSCQPVSLRISQVWQNDGPRLPKWLQNGPQN